MSKNVKKQLLTNVTIREGVQIKLLNGTAEIGYTIEGFSNYYINLKGEICSIALMKPLIFRLKYSHTYCIVVKVYTLLDDYSKEFREVIAHELIINNAMEFENEKDDDVPKFLDNKQRFFIPKNGSVINLHPDNILVCDKEDARRFTESKLVNYTPHQLYGISYLDFRRRVDDEDVDVDIVTVCGILNVVPEVVNAILIHQDLLQGSLYAYNNISIYRKNEKRLNYTREDVMGLEYVILDVKTSVGTVYKDPKFEKIPTVMKKKKNVMLDVILNFKNKGFNGCILKDDDENPKKELYFLSGFNGKLSDKQK